MPHASRANVDYLWQNLKTSAPMLLADAIAILVATVLAAVLDQQLVSGGRTGWAALFAGTFVAIAIAYLVFDLYPGCGLVAASEFRQTATASTLVFLGLGAAWSIQSPHERPLSFVALGILWVGAIVAVPTFRSMARSLCSRFAWWLTPVLIVCDRDDGKTVLDAVRRNPRSGLRPAGVVYDPEVNWQDGEDDSDSNVIEQLRAIADLSRECRAYRAIVTRTSPYCDELCRPGSGVPHTHVIANTPDRPTLGTRVGELAGLPEVRIKDRLLLPSSRLLKRAMDLSLLLAMSPLLLPLLVVIALVIRFTSPGPVFYTQRRLGLGGEHFLIWKFRTMVLQADRVLQDCLEADPKLRGEFETHHKLRNDPRVTAIGVFLRKTSLDELPQLLNVLCGDMSLVGPRPHPVDWVDQRPEAYESCRLVPPGITGLWQISGRNNTTFETRIALDRYYTCNWSIWLDAFILLRTVRTVLLREGAY